MSSEVKQILQAIEDQSNFPGAGSFLAETPLEKWLGGSAVVFLILFLGLLFFESTRTYGLVAGLFFLLTVIGFSIVQTFSIVKTFRRPLSGFAEEARKRLEARSTYVSALATFSLEGLRTVKIALESDMGRIQKRLGVLVGAVEKVGFIPAGVTLYYAAFEASSSTQLPANILMAFVFGLYAGAFLGHRLIEALCFNSSCIDDAYELSLNREKFENPDRYLQLRS